MAADFQKTRAALFSAYQRAGGKLSAEQLDEQIAQAVLQVPVKTYRCSPIEAAGRALHEALEDLSDRQEVSKIKGER